MNVIHAFLRRLFTTDGRREATFQAFALWVFRQAGFRVVRKSRTSVSAVLLSNGAVVHEALAVSVGSFVDFILLPGLNYPLEAVPRYLTAFLLWRNQRIACAGWRAMFSPDGCTMVLGQVIHPKGIKRDHAAWMLTAMVKEAEFTSRYVQKHVGAPC